MGKDKLEDLIRKETQGPSLGEAVGGAALMGALIGITKVLGCIFSSKRKI